MPDTPVAAPAAAPVAAPTPAPVSAPVSTPVPTTTPSVATEQTPATPAVPATPPAASTPAGPKREDFPQTAEGIEQFLRAKNEYEEKNPDGTQFTTGDEVPVEPDAQDVPAADKPAEEQTATEDKPEQPKLGEEAAPTPQELQEILTGDPTLAAAIEANPAAKGKIFSMARKLAAAEPILAIVPNADVAKFAMDNANQFVGLKTAFQLSDSPEKMKGAADMFLQQFEIVDDKGAPVLDAAGNKTYGEDLPMFVSEIKNRDTTARIGQLKERIDANKYVSAEGKENDEQLLAAYEFIAAAEAAGPDALDKPDLSAMTPEARAYFERKEAELNAERERLGLKEKSLTDKQRSENRQKFDTQYREDFGRGTGQFLSNYLKQKEADGVVIPHYLLTMKDPKTGVSVFALQAFSKLNEKLNTIPSVKAHSATLQMNAINDAGLKARTEYGASLREEHLPGIIDELLREAGVSIAADAQRRSQARQDGRQDARVEPSSSARAAQRGKTDQEIYKQAQAVVDEKYKGQFLDPARRMELTLIERNKLESQR